VAKKKKHSQPARLTLLSQLEDLRKRCDHLQGRLDAANGTIATMVDNSRVVAIEITHLRGFLHNAYALAWNVKNHVTPGWDKKDGH